MYSIFGLIAGLIHVYIFVLESYLWGKPKTNKVFGVTPEQAETNRVFAFNQGYYNLFLAIGALVGAHLTFHSGSEIGKTLLLFSCGSMLGAAIVLIFSNSEKKLIRPALIQGLPPLLAIAGWVISDFIS